MAKMTGHNWSVSSPTLGTFSFISITPNQPTRGSVDMSDLSTLNWLEFIPADLADGGELTFTGYFEGQDPGPLLTMSPETFTVQFGNVTGDPQWSFQGFVTSLAPQQAQSNQRAEVQVTIKVTGGITVGTL